MTNIKITRIIDGIQNINLFNHSNFNDVGKDIVCASVSTLAFYTISALKLFEKSQFVKVDVDSKNTMIRFETIQFEDISQKLLVLLIGHLKELETRYKNNIKIEEK